MDKRVLLRFVKLMTVLMAAVFVLLFHTSSVRAEESEGVALEMRLKTSDEDDGILLHSSNVDGTQYFFLPSGVSEENLAPLFGEDAVYETMKSTNIASLHFFSSSADKGISYVHEAKGNTAPGEVYLYDENFNELYHGKVDALKGRGNTTWAGTDKKSYQLKLAKKADLLDPAGGSQKAKKWILLANPFDPTLMRNYMIYNFAKELGLTNTPEGRPVDFYYDGEYRGSYYLCEKVEIGDGRVEIDELEKAVEKANPDVDFDALEEVTDVNSHGYEVKYEDGITDPEDLSGGYLLELDSAYYTTEKSWFRFFGSGSAVVKSPEYTSKSMMEYISVLFDDMFEYARLAQLGRNDGTELSKYIDLDSFARYYLVNEWFANNDVWVSSTFLYKPKGDDLFYAGPVWDCDSSLRIRDENRAYDQWFSEGLGKRLLGIPSFREKIQEVYQSEMRTLIYDVLLGTGSGQYLKSVEAMKEELAASAAMNYKIWEMNDCAGAYVLQDTPEANFETDLAWLKARAAWFDEEILNDGFVPQADSSRIYGGTRYETSLNVADALKAQLGVDRFSAVILAYGKNYADALAGSYLANVLQAPILLIDERKDHIAAVRDYIRENLDPEGKVYVLGGTSVISENAVSGLSDYDVLRLWGKTRYETNLEILREAAKYAEDASEILVCSGTGFADSLSAAAVGKPILLVRSNLLKSQKEYLASLGQKIRITIIGGPKAVSEAAEKELAAYGSVSRIGGSTRYETSVKVAETFFENPKTCILAYGENFPDGLSGGVLANTMGGPLILAANGKTRFAEQYAAAKGLRKGLVLGGPTLISDESMRKVFGLEE